MSSNYSSLRTRLGTMRRSDMLCKYGITVLQRQRASDNSSMHPIRHLEANLFIVCGCIPTLKKFIRRFIPGPLDSDMFHGSTESRFNQRSTYRHCEEEIEMPKFTGYRKAMANPVMEEPVEIGAGSLHGDDRSDWAIFETKAFILRCGHDVDNNGLINSRKS